jgi:predicted small lipoprotein YifL
MILRVLLVLGLSVSLASCGVKNDLMLPNGKDAPKGQKDPSKPPQPIG